MSKKIKKYKVIPRYDRALVQQLPEEAYNKKFQSEIIDAPTISEGTAPVIFAEVIAFGDKCEGLEKGMTIGFQNGSGMEWQNAEEKQRLIRDQDIVVILEEED